MHSEILKDKFEGFVLAGGKSSRMGTNKAFLKIENETFIERAFKTLTQICEGRVRIILNSNQSAADFSSFNYIRDIFPERGALGGIHSALSNSKCEWIIILACDLPLITSKTIAGLSKITLGLSCNIAAVVPKQPEGKVHSLCALYRPSLCLSHLTELLQTNNSASVRDFLELIPVFYVDAGKSPFTDESFFFNVNKPEDYDLLFGK